MNTRLFCLVAGLLAVSSPVLAQVTKAKAFVPPRTAGRASGFAGFLVQ